MPPHRGQPVSNPFGRFPSSMTSKAPDAGHVASWAPASRPKGISGLVLKERLACISMRRASVISVLLHAFVPPTLVMMALLALMILSWVLHLDWRDWFRARPVKPDMVFSLVNDTHADRPEKPLFKGNFNQRAGGKRASRSPRPVETPARPQAPQQPVKQASTQPERPTNPVKPARTQPTPKPAESRPKTQPSPQAETPQVATPASPQRQSVKPTSPEPQKNASTASEHPSPRQGAASAATAPDGSGNIVAHADQGGNAKSGVDVAQDVDYGPYMADLQRRIRRNWQAPRMERSTRIVVEFYIGRDGRLVTPQGDALRPDQDPAEAVKILRTSGDSESDRAAIEAVRLSAPFQPFPPQEKADLLPINFTFDYNVFHPGGSRRASKS